jgi:hypothetical protein
MLDEMNSFCKGSWDACLIVHMMKADVYSIYSHREDLDTEEFVRICEERITKYMNRSELKRTKKETRAIREIRLYLLGIK